MRTFGLHPVAALGVALLLSACAGKPPPPASVAGTIQASAQINPSASKRPSPLLIRVYELKSVAAFNAADFMSLYQRDQAALSADLLAKEEFVLEPKIFAEFYQVANPERDRGKGLGMGLAIVKRLSELLGHELTVRSRPGAGSVFRVWVARVHAAQMDEFTVGAETLPGALDDTRAVLLLDDEEAIRTSVGELLAEWGYEVIAASTIAEAIAAAERRQGMIDVIVSDLRLRDGEDGLRAIEQIRQACGFDVPALLVTGDTAPEQVLRVHESGHIVLYKPVQPKELLTVLKKLA